MGCLNKIWIPSEPVHEFTGGEERGTVRSEIRRKGGGEPCGLLIVDDDVPTVETVWDSIAWPEIGHRLKLKLLTAFRRPKR